MMYLTAIFTLYKNVEPSEPLSKTRKSQIPNSTIVHHTYILIEMTPFRLLNF